MSGPTPGPWRVEGRYRNADGTTGKLISHGTNAHEDGPEDYNMRVSGASKEDLALVLAAPDMLAALQAFMKCIDTDQEMLDYAAAEDAIRAAIAKATVAA